MKKVVILAALLSIMGAGSAMACAGCGCAAKKTAKPAVTCKKCGEAKGAKKCCKPAAKCAKCGLHKSSPGCAAACKKK